MNAHGPTPSVPSTVDTAGFGTSLNGALGGFQGLFPSPSFLTAFATGAPPSTAQGLDEMIASWLNHDGGAMATESALAVAFSDQSHMDAASMGITGFGIDYSQPSQSSYFRTGERPRSADTFGGPSFAFANQPSYNNHDSISTGVTGGAGSVSGVSPAANTSTRPRRQTMAADTWESGMSNPQQSDDFMGGAVSRPESPPPREITSPEEVVAELNVSHPAGAPVVSHADACRW